MSDLDVVPLTTLKTVTVTFPVTPADSPEGSPSRFAAELLERSISYVDKVDVGALVSAALPLVFDQDPEEWKHDGSDEICVDCQQKYGPSPKAAAEHILRLTALVETTLAEVKQHLARRMAMDFAMNLLPTLENKEHNQS